MVKLNETQWRILELIDLEDEQVPLTVDHPAFKLKETDSMLKIRELVFNVELLIEQGYLEAEEAFYEASDKMSFEYMNSAVAIDLSKVKMTALGSSLIADRNMAAQLTLWNRTHRFFKGLFAFSLPQWVFILLLAGCCVYLGYRL